MPSVAPRQLAIETMFDHLNATRSIWPRIGWGLFLCVLVGSSLAALGLGLSVWSVLIAIIVLLITWRAPYAVFYTAIFVAPFIGWVISLSTGTVEIGERAFGGSIDVPMSDLIALIALAAWAFRLLFIWHKRKQNDWKPWLPLGVSFGLLVAAHLLSSFSFSEPNPFFVIKYSLRPVLFSYMAWVLLPVNFLRSRRRFITTLGVLITSGMIFALDGLRSLFVLGGPLHRARPLPIFGVSPIGTNHNVLAEWLVFVAPIALCVAELVEDARAKKVLYGIAGFITLIALLTFARSAWITLILQAGCLLYFNYRRELRTHLRSLIVGAFLLSPLAIYMVLFSSRTEIQGSTDARAMLTGIAWNLFTNSPLIGAGAGTFVERVGSTWIFAYEFGAPLDSHGMIQKVLAETGAIGFVALCFVLLVLARFVWRVWYAFKIDSIERRAYACLIVATVGAFSYQLFNTTYWSAKLWLPVGILLAGGRILLSRERAQDPDFLLTHDV